jgi:CheY-like chemotaxis protein
MNAVDVRRTWTLPDHDRATLLDAIDGGLVGGDAGIDAGKRTHLRLSGVELTATHAAGGVGRFTVFTRNIGPNGMAILHSGFLHEHTECEITMPTVWNAKETVHAIVVRCRHVGGLAHEVELAFTKPVDIRWFVERGPALTKLLTQDMDKTQIRGRILILDDQAIENELIKYHLRGTSVRVEAVTKPGEALDLLRTNNFDLILCDLNLDGGQKGEDVIIQMRKLGCSAPILALTGETSPQRLAAATEAGAVGIIEKPVDAARLLGMVVEWLLEASQKQSGGAEPIHSALACTPGGAEIVRSFLNYVARQQNAIQKAIDADNVNEVRTICLGLKESGGTAGFVSLSDTALEAVKALDASSCIAESLRQISAMRAVCARLRAEPAPAQKG